MIDRICRDGTWSCEFLEGKYLRPDRPMMGPHRSTPESPMGLWGFWRPCLLTHRTKSVCRLQARNEPPPPTGLGSRGGFPVGSF